MWWWGNLQVAASGPTLVVDDVFDGAADTVLSNHTIAPTNTLSMTWTSGTIGTSELKLNGSGIVVPIDTYSSNRLSADINGGHFAALDFSPDFWGRVALHEAADDSTYLMISPHNATDNVYVLDSGTQNIGPYAVGHLDTLGIGSDGAATPTYYVYNSTNGGSSWTLLGSTTASGARSSKRVQLSSNETFCTITRFRLWTDWTPW